MKSIHKIRGMGGGAGPLWTPAALTSLRLWLRSDLGIVLSGSDVDGWEDQSGNAFNLSALGASNRPLYIASGGVGSRPAVHFDDVATPEYLLQTVANFAWGGVAGPLTVAVVLQVTTHVASGRVVAYHASTGRPMWLGGAPSGTWSWWPCSATGNLTTTPNFLTSPGTMVGVLEGLPSASDAVSYAAVIGAASLPEIDRDAQASVTGADGSKWAVGATPGGGAAVRAKVAEIVVTRTAWDAPTRAQWLAYVNARYA